MADDVPFVESGPCAVGTGFVGREDGGTEPTELRECDGDIEAGCIDCDDDACGRRARAAICSLRTFQTLTTEDFCGGGWVAATGGGCVFEAVAVGGSPLTILTSEKSAVRKEGEGGLVAKMMDELGVISVLVAVELDFVANEEKVLLLVLDEVDMSLAVSRDDAGCETTRWDGAEIGERIF